MTFCQWTTQLIKPIILFALLPQWCHTTVTLQNHSFTVKPVLSGRPLLSGHLPKCLKCCKWTKAINKIRQENWKHIVSVHVYLCTIGADMYFHFRWFSKSSPLKFVARLIVSTPNSVMAHFLINVWVILKLGGNHSIIQAFSTWGYYTLTGKQERPMIDCKIVCIFVYSSTREQSDKRTVARLKTEARGRGAHETIMPR